jgi:hypothetical protein
MEIKNLNSRMINAYKGVSNAVPPKGKSAAANSKKAGGDNFDKIEFDFGRSAEAAKHDIAVAVAADAGTARIEQLQTAYQGDSSPVTSQQITDSILG